MEMAYELTFKYCCGCGKTAQYCQIFIALPQSKFICENCVILCVSTLAVESPQDIRIWCVDEIMRILEEPIKTVARWKEIISKKETSTGEK